MFATFQRRQPLPKFLVEGGKLDCACLIVLLKEPQSFPNHFTSRVIAARRYFAGNIFFQLRCQRNIHGDNLFPIFHLPVNNSLC